MEEGWGEVEMICLEGIPPYAPLPQRVRVRRKRGPEGIVEEEKRALQNNKWREGKIDAFFERRKRDRSVEGGSETPMKKRKQSASNEGMKNPKAPKRRSKKDLNCKEISSFFTKLPTRPSSKDGRGGPTATQLTHQTHRYCTD